MSEVSEAGVAGVASEASEMSAGAPAPAPQRQRLPDTRNAVTRKLTLIASQDETPVEIDVYVTVGLYDDGRPGEVFVKIGKQGETLGGFADAVALCMSIGLQHGVPLAAFTSKLRHLRFQPAGRTADPAQRSATSLLDLVAGWLDRQFGITGEREVRRGA